MSPKLQLPIPKLGLSDDTANAEQPPQTTRRAFDVRLIDPRTGRSRVAQRSGMRKFWTNSKGGPIQYAAVVPYNAPKVEFTQLTETTNGTTSPALLTEEWRVRVDDFGRACRTDFQGNVYVLLDDNRIQVWNSDGILLDTITPPLKPGERIEQAFDVDEARRVYAACVSDTEARSRVFQWVRIEDEENKDFLYFDLRWTLEVDGTVVELTAQAGGLWLTRNFAQGESVAHVTKYGALGGTSQPILEFDTGAPFPIRDHALSATGELYISCPSNPARGAAPDLGGLHEPTTSWTPHDLGFDTTTPIDEDTAGKYRLHAWCDAKAIQGLTTGQFVTTVPDCRYLHTQNTAPAGGQPGGTETAPDEYEDGPLDTTNRPIYALHETDSTHRRGPQYIATGVAGQAACLFTNTYDPDGAGYPGMVLRSSLNTSAAFKPDTSGPQSQGSDSDVTDITLATTWTPIAAITVTVGVLDPGTVNAIVTGLLEITGTGLVTVQARATLEDLPIGLAVSLDRQAGTHSFTLDLPVLGHLDGDYSVEFRQIQPTLTNGARLLGATQATVETVYFNDSAPDQDGTLPQQAAIVPGQSGIGEFGDTWTTISAWRIVDTTRIGMMAYQKGNTHQWALLSNARIIGQTLVQAGGWLTFISNRMTGGESVPFSVPGLTGGTFATFRGISADCDPDDLNGGKYAVVAIQCDLAGVNKSFWRVNGVAAGRFTIDQIEAWGPSSMVVIGNPHRLTTPHESDLFPPEVPFGPFDGYWMSWQTVLGSTSNSSSTANDVPVTYPTTGGLPYTAGDIDGSLDPGDYNTDTPDTTGSYTGLATEIERLEGALAHDTGLALFLPSGNTSGTVTPPYPDHPFGGAVMPPVGFAEPVTISDLDRVLKSPRPILAKLGSSGAGFVWALNGSGLGTACVALPDRYVASMGERDPLDAGKTDVVLRRIFDGGETYSTSEDDGAWVYEDGDLDTDFDQTQLIADDAGQVYWSIAQELTLAKHRGSDGTRLWSYTPANGQNLRQVALDPKVPLWPDSSEEEDRSPIFAYIVGDGFAKLRMVAETQVIGDTASPRMHRYIAVSGGTLSSGAPGSMSTNVSGGGFLLDSEATFVTGCNLFPKHYIVDGRSIAVYEPILNTGAMLEASGRGEVPKRPRLVAGWLNRLIVARTQDDGSTLFASAVGDAEDWDYFPVNPSPLDAWNSTLGVGPGSPPDLITALLVLDDILIVGCDHSIFKIVGDPRAGGRIQLVSDETGIAFGRAWCKDPDGLVYFYGQRGGVWQLSRGLDFLIEARRITRDTIERATQEVDLSTNRVEMAWNYTDEGMHVAFPPYVLG